MSRYIQRIALLGKERWIGWEVDGLGTEIPGMTLADDMPDDELQRRGVKEFHPLPFEKMIGMTAVVGNAGAGELLDEDIAFRLDALQVAMERLRSQGLTAVPRSLLVAIFGSEAHVDDVRVRQRLFEWQRAGAVEFVGRDECWVQITGRFA